MLEVRDLRVGFDRPSGPRYAVDGVSFEVAEGEFFLVIGESGSGKSLTGGAVVGLSPENAVVSGSIRFKGRELLGQPERILREVRGRDIGMVYQNPLSALNPVWTVGDQIAEALLIHGLADRRRAALRAVQWLERVHIPDPARVARSFPHEISGGMRQRAVIAMALACNPALLIADEPTTALDVTIKAQVLDLLVELRRDLNLAVLLITHDMSVVAEVADRVLVMYAGRAAEIGPTDEILSAPAHPYTEALMLSGGLSEAPFKSHLRTIPGAAPSLDARPSGCPFHPRCAYARSDCLERRPELSAVRGTRAACWHPLGAPLAGAVA